MNNENKKLPADPERSEIGAEDSDTSDRPAKRRGLSNATWRTIGKVIKYLAFIFVFAISALLIWRMLSNGDPKSMTSLMVSDKTLAAYEEYLAGNDATFTMYYQNHPQLTSSDHNRGYFGVTYVTVIPEARQVQVVFRYNNSTLRYVAEDLKLNSVPDRDDDIFDVTLVLVTDLTPDNKDDNDGMDPVKNPDKVKATRYTASQMMTDKKNVYNYRKFIFEDVDITDDTLAAFVDIYYNGPDAEGNPVIPDYSAEAMGALRIYSYRSERIYRELTADDKAALDDHRKKIG